MPCHQALSLRSLARALELSDGPEQLAAELELSTPHLKLMLGGSHVPEETFLRVVDLLIDRGLGGLTERRMASAHAQSSWQGHVLAMDTSELPSGFEPDQATALVNALANLPTRKRIAESSFKWLPIDAFEWLTQEQKETYLFEITKQLGLHPSATCKT